MAIKMEELLRPLTYADLEAYEDPLSRYEIINGELIVSPAPAPDHGQLVLALYDAFKSSVKAGKLGRLWVAPVDVELGLHNIIQPDLLFISRDRLGMVGKIIRGVPDLAVEVVLPGSLRQDYVAKRALYELAGVKEYWIVDPMRRSITVLVLENGAYVSVEPGDGFARSTVVPGVEIEIFPLFEDL
jgi:Uma2 family endonuclease